MQLLETDFVNLLNGISEGGQPVRDVMLWADDCCDRLMSANRSMGGEDRATMSSRSILIRWGYVTSQIMRDLVGISYVSRFAFIHSVSDYSE